VLDLSPRCSLTPPYPDLQGRDLTVGSVQVLAGERSKSDTYIQNVGVFFINGPVLGQLLDDIQGFGVNFG